MKYMRLEPPMLAGIALVFIFSLFASVLSGILAEYGIHLSGLIVGMLLGMVYAHTLAYFVPEAWGPGIKFCARYILKAAIIFYGFRLTFQDITTLGISGVVISALMVGLTFVVGYVVGTKVLKLDRETTILTASGSAICGAAAVLATESVLKAPAHKSVVAVATTVLFGTLAVFLYPLLYGMGLIPLDMHAMGVYIGASLHAVGHVAAAGHEVGLECANAAVIVKMLRIAMLGPFLIILSVWLVRSGVQVQKGETQKIHIPWFAIFFIVMAGVNSLNIVSQDWVARIDVADNFALTMAMCALGMGTSIHQFKDIGAKPLYLAGLLFIWLVFGGYFVTTSVLSLMPI